MIQFLKESTFAANEVFVRSLFLLKDRYFSIAGLCFLLFVTSNLSGVLAFYLHGINPVLRAFMALLFVVLYFGLQLTLFKYLLAQMNGKVHIRLKESLPTPRELLYFFVSMLVIVLLAIACFLVISLLGWPFIYTGIGIEVMVSVSMIVSAILTFLFLLRVAFYPFFIIDKAAAPFRAIRLSFALTRGNVTKLLLILLFFAILHFLNGYFNYQGLPVLSVALNVINSFLIVPLSSVVVAMAYHTMMKGGGQGRITADAGSLVRD